jgi:hypothetical protein
LQRRHEELLGGPGEVYEVFCGDVAGIERDRSRWRPLEPEAFDQSCDGGMHSNRRQMAEALSVDHGQSLSGGGDQDTADAEASTVWFGDHNVDAASDRVWFETQVM